MTSPHQSVNHDITPKALLTTPSFRKQSPLQTVSLRVSHRYPTRIRNPPSKYSTYPFAQLLTFEQLCSLVMYCIILGGRMCNIV